MPAPPACDVLVVGAGPTGLALAIQLQRFGARFRIVDRAVDRAHESRALAIQPRTLEQLAAAGLAGQLVDRGNATVGLRLHAPGRTVRVPLFDIGLDDTDYPFLLFLSQAETEAVLGQHLAARGVAVERGVELTAVDQRPGDVACSLRHTGDRVERTTARYVVGCDGPSSTVRGRAGIDFAGGRYPHTFVLADLDVDGLDPGDAHVYLAPTGMLFFFPLVRPAGWRLLGWPPSGAPEPSPGGAAPPTRDALDALARAYTGGSLRLHDPVWSTWFRLHHRHATSYRSGRLFVAGDAAHVHSPAGAQGMNTGIQDAWNLGWKLALVCSGRAAPELLDSYEPERRPVGRGVLRMSDRAFGVATSRSAPARFARTRVAPRLAALSGRAPRARARGFRSVAQLTVTYRDSPAVDGGPARRRWRGPRPGDRLPDAPVRAAGAATTLHRALAGPRLHLLLTGPPPPGGTSDAGRLAERWRGLVEVHHLSGSPSPGVLHDHSGEARRRLGLGEGDTAHHLVRPDGHIAYRGDGHDLTGVTDHLARWFPRPATSVRIDST